MKTSTKTIVLIVFLLGYVMTFAYSPRFHFRGLDIGQSSKSKENEEEESEELKKCKDELLAEFNSFDPLNDFLHAFLNIKYHTVFWNSATNTNEQIYRGRNDLKKSTKGYYFELFYTALELGLPELPSPKEYCTKRYERDLDLCIRSIASIGCKADDRGLVCFEKLYFHWKYRNEPSSTIAPGTENFTDKELLQAITRGSHSFCNLSDVDLFKAIAERSDIMHELSDEELLQDYNSRFEFDPNERYNSMDSYETRHIRTYFHGIPDYKEYKEEEKRKKQLHDEYLQYKSDQQKYLFEVRLRRYGITDVSYADICKEYKRRRNQPFDNHYGMYLHDRIKNKFKSSKLKNRKKYCEKYLSELQENNISSNSYNNHTI